MRENTRGNQDISNIELFRTYLSPIKVKTYLEKFFKVLLIYLVSWKS